MKAEQTEGLRCTDMRVWEEMQGLSRGKSLAGVEKISNLKRV